MEAIVLAGGMGTRLKSVVSEVPKPMAPVNGKPFLDYILRDLKQKGIDKVVLSVGYKHEVIRERYRNQWEGISISYAIENEPLGTGGGISLALKQCHEDQVFVVNGDTYFDVDIQGMLRKHKEQNALITLALKTMHHFDRYGTVEMENDRIREFEEKQFKEEGLINGGIYVLSRESFMKLEFPPRYSFEEDFLKAYVNKEVMNGYVSDGYFIDIGIPEDYQKAQHEFS